MEAAIYTLWAVYLSVTTGEPLAAYPEGDPTTLEQCIEASIVKGPQLAVDDKVATFLCRRPEDEVSG